MTEVTRITIHYLEAIAARAQLSGFDEIRAELEAADEADEQTRRQERAQLQAQIDQLVRLSPEAR